MRPLRRITVRPAVPTALSPLADLARNLHSTWDPAAQELFASVDRAAWEEAGYNPVRLLNQVPAARLDALAADRAFTSRLTAESARLTRVLEEPRWYQSLEDAPTAIGYFSPEFGVSEVLPQYSGGLGVLAGDHLKAASDLGLPLYGVGLFYRLGYFSQSLSSDGMQQERYPVLDPDELPMELACDASGEPLRIHIQFPGALLQAQVWKVAVGRVTLLLLDSEVPENAPAEKVVTDRLYGGNSEHRLRQEILLGIGGVRALTACGVHPEVFHTNEGHAGFLGLERIRRLIHEHGLDARSAIEAVRAGTIFTTHTPVPAGIDRFPRDLVERYFGPSGLETGLSTGEILALGHEPGTDGSLFNMAVMGLRLSQRSNGVSRLHGHVSRTMFSNLWPGLEVDDVPIGHITNGVHAGTWITRDCAEVYERRLGPDYGVRSESWDAVFKLRDEELWGVRTRLRRRLVDEIRTRLRSSWRKLGVADEQLGWVDRAFDPRVLTVGFARRVPSYKRLTLILRNPERLRRLLLDDERPIQIVVAGKSHPADDGGKKLLKQFVEFAADHDVRHRIVFLPDYDMAMARFLVAGADVWLNNPLRPFEACGTSGMKAALNGALNLSIRDGWWDELYDGWNGWAIPSADGAADPEARDDFEAGAIYDLLEHEVRPLFYDRVDGIPKRWIAMVKHSIESLGPPLLASRMVRDYTERLYVPAAHSSREVAARDFSGARELADWKSRVGSAWPAISVRHVEMGNGQFRAGDRHTLRAIVHLGRLEPDDVEVQVAYGRVDDREQIRDAAFQPLALARNGEGEAVFEGEVELSAAGAFGYTVRVVPKRGGAPAPSELGLITWA